MHGAHPAHTSSKRRRADTSRREAISVLGKRKSVVRFHANAITSVPQPRTLDDAIEDFEGARLGEAVGVADVVQQQRHQRRPVGGHVEAGHLGNDCGQHPRQPAVGFAQHKDNLLADRALLLVADSAAVIIWGKGLIG